MHQSSVYALLIDTPEAEAAPAASFWSAALGATARPVAQEPQFTLLHQALPGLVTYVQAVDDAQALTVPLMYPSPGHGPRAPHRGDGRHDARHHLTRLDVGRAARLRANVW
jgi:hypothetical protein